MPLKHTAEAPVQHPPHLSRIGAPLHQTSAQRHTSGEIEVNLPRYLLTTNGPKDASSLPPNSWELSAGLVLPAVRTMPMRSPPRGERRTDAPRPARTSARDFLRVFSQEPQTNCHDKQGRITIPAQYAGLSDNLVVIGSNPFEIWDAAAWNTLPAPKAEFCCPRASPRVSPPWSNLAGATATARVSLSPRTTLP